MISSCIYTEIKQVYSGKDDSYLKDNKQECNSLKILNECFVQIEIGNHMYISKLAGLSFDTKPCNSSWTKDQLRSLKICLLDYLIKWRTGINKLYIVDVSDKNDYSSILLVARNYNGHYQLNSLLLTRRSAVYDQDYRGPYSEDMNTRYKESLKSDTGLYGDFDSDLLDRFIPKKFNIKDFPQNINSLNHNDKNLNGLVSYPRKQ